MLMNRMARYIHVSQSSLRRYSESCLRFLGFWAFRLFALSPFDCERQWSVSIRCSVWWCH